MPNPAFAVRGFLYSYISRASTCQSLINFIKKYRFKKYIAAIFQ
jgi:hypothetical protein